MLPGFRDIVTTLLARGVAMAGPFGVSIITARVLGPEDRGHYFLIFSYAQIAAQIANLGLHSSNTYLGARRPELVGRLLVNSLYVAAVVAPFVALILVLLMGRPDLIGLPAPVEGSAGSIAFTAVLLAPLMVAFIYLTNLAVGIGRIRLFNGLTIFAGLVAIVAAGIAAVVGNGTLDFLLAASAALVASCLVGSTLLLSGTRVAPTFDCALFRQGVAYALRAYLATLLGFLMMRVGILALQQQANLEEIGQFSIAMQIADALILLPATFGLLLFPHLVRTGEEDKWRATVQALWRLGLLMSALLAVLALLLPWILPLIFGATYQPAVLLSETMLVPVLIMSLTTILSQFLAAKGFPWRQVLAWLVGFATQAGLSYWLAASYGGLGVAIALTVSSSLVLAMIGIEAAR